MRCPIGKRSTVVVLISVALLSACGSSSGDTAARDRCEALAGVGRCLQRSGRWVPIGSINGTTTTTTTVRTTTSVSRPTTTTSTTTTTSPPTTPETAAATTTATVPPTFAAPSTYTLTGTLALPPYEVTTYGALVGDPCPGVFSTFADIVTGAQVIVTDGSGNTLGIGTLTGTLEPSSHFGNQNTCVFAFDIGNLPRAAFYGLQFANRPKTLYSYDQLNSYGWSLTLWMVEPS